MSQIASMPEQEARQAIITMVVDRFVGLDEDPRDTTTAELLEELMEAEHWAAQDNGTDIAVELQDARSLITEVHAEYRDFKAAEAGAGDVSPEVAETYREAERQANASFQAPIFTMPGSQSPGM